MDAKELWVLTVNEKPIHPQDDDYAWMVYDDLKIAQRFAIYQNSMYGLDCEATCLGDLKITQKEIL